jgi:3'(2'), 5'-bisphosphate nucleotidase
VNPGDGALARRVAAAAGELLLEIRRALDRGPDSEAVRREGDRRSHELILSLLAEYRPADAVVSEESSGAVAPPSADRVWIVDPLDGTREFGEVGRTDFAVHVALVEGGALAAGAVALPARPGAPTYATDDVPALAPRAEGRLRVAASRTRPAAEAAVLASELDAELVPMGSAGAKIIAVLEGAVDVYVHSGGQYVWDSAAPVAIALAAGLHASRLDGSPLDYGAATTWLPDLVVCRSELRGPIFAALRSATIRLR